LTGAATSISGDAEARGGVRDTNAPESLAATLEGLTPEDVEQLALAAVPDCDAAPSESEDVRLGPKEGAASREPLDVTRERKEYYRGLQVEESTQLGAIFRNQASGEVESYAHWAPTALEAHEQLELALPGLSLRHAIRKALADALEQRVLPLCNGKWVHNYIDRLRRARWHGMWGYSVAKGKSVVFWDDKAGLSRLCPDDAREESQRLSRKVLEPLEALQADGYALHYCVFTSPNAAPGGLRKEMVRICKALRNLILKAKHADGSPVFPEIKGALCVLEAPLGSHRDWNVHLNVILVVKGYLDYKKLRAKWFMNVEAKPLAQGPGVVKGALCELIKYAAAATVTKSAEKAAQAATLRDGTPREPPPPMLEWTGSELLEWLRAMRGFRRTRTYGCLFRLPKPKAEDLGQVIWLGPVSHDGSRYRVSSALLESITEDKSLGITGPAAYIAMLRGLALPGLRGAGTLGDEIPRDALHSSIEQLRKM
jgi:hypothetical protein